MELNQRVSKLLKTISKGRFTPKMTETFFKLIDIPPQKLKEDLELFLEDIKAYGSGVLLWLKDRYSNIILMYSLGGYDLNNIHVRPNMKVVVNEYYRFINDINPLLATKEMEESYKLLFAGEVQPKNLSTKSPFINHLTAKFIQNMQNLAPQIEVYSERLIRELEIIYNKNPSTILIKFIPLLFKIKKLKKKSFLTLDKIAIDVKGISEDFKRVFDNNTAIAYLCLNLVIGIDSFNIEFTKFLARLYNNLIKETEPICHESHLKVKGYDPNIRKILKSFLEDDLKENYPNLSKYIRSMFDYNKFRILGTHRNPKVRFKNGKAFFFRSGKPELEMDLNEIFKEVNTYGFFIDSLRVFKRNCFEKHLFQRNLHLKEH